MSKSGNLISACLMVKNEERNLDRCLRSIKELVDEIVVVDTGSEDNTIEIAKRYNARIHQHDWANDFSLHRNQSISYAKGKWVLIIDADEELVIDTHIPLPKIKQFFKDCKYNAAAIVVKDMQKDKNVLQFNSTRFFRKGRVKYEGIVHNQPRIQGMALFCPFLSINHYGYDMTAEQKALKFQRTNSLLLKQVETGQVDQGLPYFYLCQLNANNDYYEEAIKWGEKYLTHRKEANGHFNQSIYYTMIKQFMKVGNQEKAKEWLNLGLEDLPGDLDLTMGALEYGVWTKDDEIVVGAARDFCRIFKSWQENPSLKGNRFVYSSRPEALAFAMFHLCSRLLQQGAFHLEELIKLLGSIPFSFRNEMLSEIESKMSKTIFPIKFKSQMGISHQTTEDQQNVPVFTQRNIQ